MSVVQVFLCRKVILKSWSSVSKRTVYLASKSIQRCVKKIVVLQRLSWGLSLVALLGVGRSESRLHLPMAKLMTWMARLIQLLSLGAPRRYGWLYMIRDLAWIMILRSPFLSVTQLLLCRNVMARSYSSVYKALHVAANCRCSVTCAR